MKKLPMLVAAGLLATTVAGAVHASSVTYYMNQTNIDQGTWIDGIGYLKVKIAANSSGGVDFTVTPLSKLTGATPLNNFGLQAFAFNTTNANLAASNISPPTNWNVSTSQQADGFGTFDFELKDGGTSRNNPLQFTISGASYSDFAKASSGSATQGNTYFAAHVAGFTGPSGVTSGWFGGSTTVVPPSDVPVPAAVWLFGSGLMGLVGVARRRRSS